MNNHAHSLGGAAKLVDRLLEQYQDYLGVTREIDELKSRLIQEAIEIGQKEHKPFTAVLAEAPATLEKLRQQIEAAEAQQQEISDEMTFANPVVWMMYKFKAYADTSNAIRDMEDFRKHCSPDGYICTTRFTFLRQYLLDMGKSDLSDTGTYPDALPLNELYASDDIASLPADEIFMRLWCAHEYYRENGKVAKWEDYRRGQAA
jgi:hypothetical protein